MYYNNVYKHVLHKYYVWYIDNNMLNSSICSVYNFYVNYLIGVMFKFEIMIIYIMK